LQSGGNRFESGILHHEQMAEWQGNWLQPSTQEFESPSVLWNIDRVVYGECLLNTWTIVPQVRILYIPPILVSTYCTLLGRGLELPIRALKNGK
jgi:hypothetical protein